MARLVLAVLLFLLAALAALDRPAVAGDLRVSEGTVVVEGDEAFVEVDVSWQLSWRTQTHWDAAWLFVKQPADWCAGTPVALAPDGHATVANRHADRPAAAVTVPADGRGAFVYRRVATEGRSENDWRLRLKLALPDGTGPEALPETLDVYGLEMVYVPGGPFFVGDPRPRAASPKHSFFRQTADTTAAPPYRVESSGPIPVCSGPGSLCYRRAERSFERGREGDFEGPIPAAYPNGYEAFYLMKYEVTQGQYAAFLTDLGRCGAPLRTIMGHPDYRARGSIQFAEEGYGFTATRPNRAAHYLSWDDAAAFADWAALRPMTELEFTKAARGPADPVAGEYAWGSTALAHGDTIFAATGSVAESEARGDEYVRGNAHYRPENASSNAFVGGDGSGGPLRVDIFEARVYAAGGDAPPNAAGFESRREASGAGFYGAQGLSGSLYERVIAATDSAGRRFQGSHGDGRLRYPAVADEPDWPGPRGHGLGMRGGEAGRTPPYLRVADRTFGSYEAYYRLGGFRAARTAP
jgi:formylglycine-generating enzyme required for sulfatase activity